MSCDFFALATPGVQGLHPYQPGKPLEALAREYGIQNAIKLASNENPLGASPLVIKAIHGILQDLTRYPDGGGFRLKQALAEKYDLSADCITLGNGSNDVLEMIARVFVKSTDSVIFSEHAFAVYPLVTQAIGAQAIVTPARNWGHDLAAMQAAVQDNTRVMFIANPNNPTGTWTRRDELKQLLDTVPETLIVVVDEAYSEYIGDTDYPNCIQWLKNYPNLVVTRTFSKAFGLAALRVGYALSNPDISNLLNRIRQPFNVNSIALAAAEAALGDVACLDKSVRLNRAGLAQLEDGFKYLNLSYIPSVCNFVSVDVGRSAEAVYEALLYEGVIVRPVSGYGMPEHLRISVGLEEENTRFLAALEKVLNQPG